MERYNHLAQEMGQVYLEKGGLLRLTVSGRSMAPLLLPGDILWFEGISTADLQPGDLVLVRRAGEMVTHRFLYADGSGWHLKGDACSFPDAAFTEDALIGRAVILERNGRKIDLKIPEMQAAARKVLWFSNLEANLFSTVKDFLSKILPSQLIPRTRFLQRLIGSPFRWINYMLLSRVVSKES
jgi:hypothetical protein